MNSKQWNGTNENEIREFFPNHKFLVITPDKGSPLLCIDEYNYAANINNYLWEEDGKIHCLSATTFEASLTVAS